MLNKTILTLLLITFCLSVLSGCTERTETVQNHLSSPLPIEETIKTDKNTPPSLLWREDGVVSIAVTSLPEGYSYSFDGDDADAIVDYLLGLNPISVFSEEPNEYTGMTWVISLTYENGETATVYHFGNMFIKTDRGPWYKISYPEASRFSSLLGELSDESKSE